LENAVILGGRRSGISVVNFSSNIHIRNCDISDWGPGDGVYDPYLGLYFVNGYVGNYMAGVHLLNGVEDILVERCYIHDANLRSNPWRRPDGKDNHPCGSSGFFVGARGGIVIRYNDVIGSDKHRFNDCIEGFLNSQLIESSVRKNSDIYGNMFYCGQDDTMELDGPMMNTRVYENRMEQTLCGISTARTTVGPAYLFNNLITNLGTEQNTDRVGAAIKMGGTGPDGYSGKVFMFNNTLDNDGMRGPYNSNGVWPTEMKNNFVNAADGKQTAVANSQAKNDMELFDIDYQTYESKNLEFVTEKQKYSTDDTLIRYTVTNISDEEATIAGDDYCFALHIRKDGEWKMVGTKTEHYWNSIALILAPGQKVEREIKLEEYYNLPLEKGEYRICMES
jgi:hypothetical protein